MRETSTIKERTAKGLIWGGFSNITLQLLNLIFGVWLSRLLSVEDYGTIGMLTIFTLVATTLQESGFTQALTNKKSPSHNDFNAVFWFSSLMGICLYIVLYFLAPLIAAFFNSPNLVLLSRYLFLGFVFASFGTAHNAYLFSHMMVKQRSIAMISGLLVSGFVGVLMAYNGYAYWGLATQSLVYVICTNLLFAYFTKWKPSFKISFSPIRGMFLFSYKILITKICIHLNNHLFNIFLGRFFNDKEVGYFSQANKWNLMGSSIISEMIQGVAQPLFSSLSNSKTEQRDAFLKMVKFTSFLSFPALFGLAFIAPEFVEVLLTEKWLNSAKLLQILCIGGAFYPINNLMSNLIISCGKSSIYMWNIIIQLIAQVVTVYLLYPLGVEIMVMGFVVVQVLWMGVWLCFVRREIAVTIISFIVSTLPYALLAILSIVISWFVVQGISNLYLLLIIKIILVSLCYFILLYLGNFNILKESFKHIRKIIFK